jgi:acetoacetyl-CoA reductase
MNHRIALVTGGTRGIGAAISQELKYADYTVVATYQGNDHAADLFEKRAGVHVFKWDVGSYEACQQGIHRIEEEIGPIDILVNNAGVTRDGMFHKMSADQWHSVIATNLTSCFNMSRAVINGMRERNFGRIINISSINGQKGQLGQVNYAAAKAGIIGFSKALALENAVKGITVNTIAPGYIETEMVSAIPQEVLHKIISNIPVNRLGTPHEIARAVLFLASEGAGFITGSTLSINGGQYMA